jgi:hypothetical protein
MTQFTDSYVAYIGLKSVTMGGKNCVRDSLINCELRNDKGDAFILRKRCTKAR